MLKSWKTLLRPLARAVWWYVGLVLLRELLHLGGSYSMSATFRVLEALKGGGGAWIWVAFLGGLALYYEIMLRTEGATLWHMTRNINVPLYRQMRAGAFARFLELPPRWHQRHNSAVLVGEVNNGVERITEIVDATGWELAPLIAATVLSLGPLVWFSPLSAVVVAAAAAVFLVLNYRIYRATEAYRVARCDRQRDDWRLSAECVRSLPSLLMANAGGRAQREYERVQDELAYNTIEECRWEVCRWGRWRDRATCWARVALIGIWLQQMRTGGLGMVDCIYVWRICEDLFTYMEGYTALFERFANNTESVRRFFALFEETPGEARPHAEAPAGRPARVEIEFRGVQFRYDPACPCLEGVNLRIGAGEVVGIVGRSGSGKSTMAKLLCGLCEPDAGDVLVNGRGVRDGWDRAQLRALISYVPQINEGGVLERTVAENIRLAVPEASIEHVMEAAAAAGLHDEVMRMPDGYETVVGESGCTLSGGQMQRLLIARELLKDAPVMILDEATSGQDVVTESRLLASMMPLLAGKTVIVISHRLSTVRRLADRIAVVEDGRIAECGTGRELLRARGRYFRMLRAGGGRCGPRRRCTGVYSGTRVRP